MQATMEANTYDSRGWMRHGGRKLSDYFVFNTDHKVIGIQYMVVAFIFFIIGGLMAEAMRTELALPETQFVGGSSYNQLFTLHGTIMIFLWIIPAFVGLANYVVPLMLGANDMAFPKLNAFSFWLTIPGAILLIASFFVGGAESGWTAYPPLSLQTPAGQTMWAIALQFIGFQFHFRRDQLPGDHLQHARARHDADAVAAARVGDGFNLDHHHPGDAGVVGGSGDADSGAPPGGHFLLRRHRR